MLACLVVPVSRRYPSFEQYSPSELSILTKIRRIRRAKVTGKSSRSSHALTDEVRSLAAEVVLRRGSGQRPCHTSRGYYGTNSMNMC